MENNERVLTKTRIIFTFVSFLCMAIGIVIGTTFTSKGNPNRGNDKIDYIYELIKDEWIFAEDYNDIDEFLTDMAIKGMTDDNKDPYTFYTSTYDAQNLTIDYKGIGIEHAYYGGNRIITTVFKDSPADKIGLKVGDIILGLYESSTSDDLIDFSMLSSQEVIDAFNNYKDENVKMRIKHINQNVDDVIVTKDYYTQSAIQEVKVIEGEEVIVMIRIHNFMDSKLINDFKDAINNVLKTHEKIDRLVIDLRNNGGGRTDLASALSSLFVPKNSLIVQYQTRRGIEKEYNRSEPIYADSVKKINFLQNNSTASASEMVILAVKENLPKEKVDVIGTYSYGKGIRQKVLALNDGSAIRYTDAYVLSPKGNSIHGIGIEPTIEVEYDYDLMNYYGEVGFVTKEYKERILCQINGVFGTEYTSYDDALSYVLADLPYDSYNYEVGRILQQKGFDLYLDAMKSASEIALGA